jgi:hypothetical protein
MIGRPTTEQILLDCARVLKDEVLPAITDETVQVRVIMCETVLRNAAARSAHEISWMIDEIAAAQAFGAEVAAHRAAGAEVGRALDWLAEHHWESLALADVAEAYNRAGEVLSVGLETAVSEGLTELRRRGEQLLELRLERELVIMAGWSSAGR